LLTKYRVRAESAISRLQLVSLIFDHETIASIKLNICDTNSRFPQNGAKLILIGYNLVEPWWTVAEGELPCIVFTYHRLSIHHLSHRYYYKLRLHLLRHKGLARSLYLLSTAWLSCRLLFTWRCSPSRSLQHGKQSAILRSLYLPTKFIVFQQMAPKLNVRPLSMQWHTSVV